MKKTTILILLISLLLSCNQNNTSDLSKEDIAYENINELTESSLLGAWKYIDSKLGEVFIQFEKDGTVKSFYNYEGEAIVMGKWQLQDNVVKMVEGSHSIETELLVSDFDGSSFKVFNSDYNEYVVYNRLRDEAGEPILYYSLFDREPKRDPYYDASEENNNSVIEENTNYNNSGSTQKQWINCKKCHGNGILSCSQCEGVGSYRCTECGGDGKANSLSGEYTCNLCHGSGTQRCNNCRGSGNSGNCHKCDGRGQVQE